MSGQRDLKEQEHEMRDEEHGNSVLEGAVRLEITGGQGEITSHHEGQCYYKNGHHYVLFREELLEDGKKKGISFSSRLKISRDQVTLRRSLPGKTENEAAHVMEFVYRRQEPTETGCIVDYPTPYGVLRLEIRTRELVIDRRAGEILVTIRYVMLQEGLEVSRDELKIHVRSN